MHGTDFKYLSRHIKCGIEETNSVGLKCSTGRALGGLFMMTFVTGCTEHHWPLTQVKCLPDKSILGSIFMAVRMKK